MKVKNAFIPAAGFGSRMGSIGKVLPKPLWPIFEKTMLELQILRLKSMGFEKIFINTHHENERISKSIENKFDKVFFLHEETILGSGGCFYNLKKHQEVNLDLVYVQNSDIFYFFDQKYFNDICENESVATLFLVRPENGSHNGVMVKDGLLDGIDKERKPRSLTYSGNGVVNLSLLKGAEGVSNFFSSVANFKNQNVKVISPEESEYWDFGTKELFHKSILEVLNNPESKMFNFLVREKALCLENVQADGYLSNSFSIKNQAICLDTNSKIEDNELLSGSIYYKGLSVNIT